VRGSGSGLDRRSTRAAGLAFDAGPERRISAAPGAGVGLGAVFFSVRNGRVAGPVDPVARHPFAAMVCGMERWGHSRDRVNQVRSTASRAPGGSDPMRPERREAIPAPRKPLRSPPTPDPRPRRHPSTPARSASARSCICGEDVGRAGCDRPEGALLLGPLPPPAAGSMSEWAT
jgi:hypothetical protein